MGKSTHPCKKCGRPTYHFHRAEYSGEREYYCVGCCTKGCKQTTLGEIQ